MIFKKIDGSQLKKKEFLALNSLEESFNLRSLSKALKTSAAGALSFARRLEAAGAIAVVH